MIVSHCVMLTSFYKVNLTTYLTTVQLLLLLLQHTTTRLRLDSGLIITAHVFTSEDWLAWQVEKRSTGLSDSAIQAGAVGGSGLEH